MTLSLKQIEEELQAEGYQPDTPTYASALLRRKVAACQGQKGVRDCRDCNYFDHCETAKAYLVELRYKKPEERSRVVTVTDRLPDWIFPTHTTGSDPRDGNK
jgi:hypothetical protein